MKTLKQRISFKGLHESISITDFRRSPGEILKAVELGMTITIERNGKEIAKLIQSPQPDENEKLS